MDVAAVTNETPRRNDLYCVEWDVKHYTVVQKNAPTLADYNCDPVQSILTIFSRLFANDHKSCPVVKFSTSPHICCHYTL